MFAAETNGAAVPLKTCLKTHPLHQVRSAGTASSACVKVSEKGIQWVDMILVMEKRHKEILQVKFCNWILNKEIIVLSIPDEYNYMDPELVTILEQHWKSIVE
ncbi:protein tyrosine phosphatase [Parapedobacter tibetensis]|uniref:protein tyrosine phosphatase n=1 Tax=Parapedobacter tibetensis TaxID=2972951 RepID=UPI00214D308D|nr:protein tyrosine phosphatase [Parapedobacter tibetensis]